MLAPFVEVLAVDSALLRLHDALQPFYPSVWTHYMKASAKLTVVMNVVARGARTVRLAHGSRHDRHLLQAGPWMKGRLLRFDLGFYGTPLLLQIDRHGGYFLSRARKHANPVIVAEQMPSANKHVSETLIYAALLSLAISRRIHHMLAPTPLDRFRMPLDRFATLLAVVAHDLLDLLLCGRDRAHRQRRIARFLRAEARDPNRARIPLPWRAQAGVLGAR